MEHMEYQNEHSRHNPTNAWSFLGGLMLGGAAGTIGMILFAPQSGARTRLQLQQKGIEIRSMATEAVENAVSETRDTAHRINQKVQHQAEKLQVRGQEVLDEQKARLAALVETESQKTQAALR